MDKMEEFNKVIDNAIEKLNALRNEPEFKKGELVWASNYDDEWFIRFFIGMKDGKFITTESTICDEETWKYCKKFDGIKIDI